MTYRTPGRPLALLLAAGVATAALLAHPVHAQDAPALPDYVVAEFGTPPAIPTGPLAEDLLDPIRAAVDHGLNQSNWDPSESDALTTIAASGDPRLGWLLVDLMQFTWRPEFRAALTDAAITLLDIELRTLTHRHEIVDHLLAWDMPAYPDYLGHKRTIYTNYVPGWQFIFNEGDIDWHLVSWGGVNIDARPPGRTDEPCNCIPAIDDPEVSTAEEATWLADDAIVFGIEINGEARAYPRRIMEIREMVNDTLGGRDLGIPYCTLCGAAQAFFTDQLPDGIDRPILRTSGLLIRSNKVMYDVKTYSVFDTFLGKAVTGLLAGRNLQLEQATVITTDWGTWKATHPDTTVLVESDALGRDFDLRNTRDANGPIFPVGDVDPRLPVHEDIVGVIAPDGTPVAFQRSAALAALRDGATVGANGVTLVEEAGGLRVLGPDGGDAGSHQAFWFAWSQFHPDTVLWPS